MWVWLCLLHSLDVFVICDYCLNLYCGQWQRLVKVCLVHSFFFQAFSPITFTFPSISIEISPTTIEINYAVKCIFFTFFSLYLNISLTLVSSFSLFLFHDSAFYLFRSSLLHFIRIWWDFSRSDARNTTDVAKVSL